MYFFYLFILLTVVTYHPSIISSGQKEGDTNITFLALSITPLIPPSKGNLRDDSFLLDFWESFIPSPLPPSTSSLLLGGSTTLHIYTSSSYFVFSPSFFYVIFQMLCHGQPIIVLPSSHSNQNC